MPSNGTRWIPTASPPERTIASGRGSRRSYPGTPPATASPNWVVEYDFVVRQTICISRRGGCERELSYARQHPAATREQKVASDPEPSLFRVGLLCGMCIGESRNGHASVIDAHDARIPVE